MSQAKNSLNRMRRLVCRKVVWTREMIEIVNTELSMLDSVVRAALRRSAFPRFLYCLDDELFYTLSRIEQAQKFATNWREFILKHNPSEEYLMSFR